MHFTFTLRGLLEFCNGDMAQKPRMMLLSDVKKFEDMCIPLDVWIGGQTDRMGKEISRFVFYSMLTRHRNAEFLMENF